MANEQITITVTTPAGSGLTVAPHGAVQPESGQTFDLFNRANEAGEYDQLETAKTPPAAAESVAVAKKPWETSTERGKGLNFQPDELLHAKMNWVCDNVPRMSRLRILRDGAMAECDRLIELHYKG
jgi:hypothetical protein